jgi:hypothetical protein
LTESLSRQFEAVKRVGSVLGVSGLLAAGIGGEALPIGISEAQGSPEQAATLHSRSPLHIQPILNRIHKIAIPLDQEATIKPTSAFMLPSSAGFRTDCNDGFAGYRSYKVNPLGTSFEPCGQFIPFLQKSKINQYVEPLNKVGSDIRRSVGYAAVQSTSSIRGNRRTLTVRYDCVESGIRKIVLSDPNKLRRHRKPLLRYTKATIVTC